MKRGKETTKRENETRNNILAVIIPSIVVVFLYIAYNAVSSNPTKRNEDVFKYCSDTKCGQFEQGDRYHIVYVAYSHPTIVVEKDGDICTIGISFTWPDKENKAIQKVRVVSPDYVFYRWCKAGGTYFGLPLEGAHVVLRNQTMTAGQSAFLNKHYNTHQIKRDTHWYQETELDFSRFTRGCEYGKGKTTNCGNFVATFLRLGDGEAKSVGSKLENGDQVARIIKLLGTRAKKEGAA